MRKVVEKVIERLEGTSEHTHQAMEFTRKKERQRYLIKQPSFKGIFPQRGAFVFADRKAQGF